MPPRNIYTRSRKSQVSCGFAVLGTPIYTYTYWYAVAWVTVFVMVVRRFSVGAAPEIELISVYSNSMPHPKTDPEKKEKCSPIDKKIKCDT